MINQKYSVVNPANIEEFKSKKNEIKIFAEHICNEYIETNSPNEINITATIKRNILTQKDECNISYNLVNPKRFTAAFDEMNLLLSAGITLIDYESTLKTSF
jgi:hypothetical protein